MRKGNIILENSLSLQSFFDIVSQKGLCLRSLMDRISDSGSDGCGSIPHGGTSVFIPHFVWVMSGLDFRGQIFKDDAVYYLRIT